MMSYLQLLVHGCLICRHTQHLVRSKHFFQQIHAFSIARRRSLSRHSSNVTFRHSSHLTMIDDQHKPLVIVLAGPTASGKSAVAALLSSPSWATAILTGHARNNQPTSWTLSKSMAITDDSIPARGHVISADSVQVYCGVQIGANKPTLEEMKQTPHHLVSIIDPQIVYNAADWRKDALYVIQKLTLSKESIIPEEEEEEEEEVEASLQILDKNRRDKIDQYMESTLDTHSNHSSKILSIVTGGTMMYLQWLVYGCPDVAKPTPEALSRAAEIIQSYQAMENTMNDDEDATTPVTTNPVWMQAVQHVASLGPIFAQRVLSLSENDWYRLRRTLEVAFTVLPVSPKFESIQHPSSSYTQTTETMVTTTTTQDIMDTAHLKEETIQSLYNGQRQGGLDSFHYDVRCFFLCPDDRMAHSKIVDCRCEDMILAGLLTETTRLYLDGSLPEEGQQTRAIGYRQTLDYLLRPDWKEKDESAFFHYLDEFTTATRRYSKKQMQWFRKDEAFVFIPLSLSEENHSTRVTEAATRIRDLCIQSRQEFESEKSSTKSISSETKQKNAMQSRGMKFFMPQRFRIVHGSLELDRILNEADTCVRMIRSGNPTTCIQSSAMMIM